MERIRQPSVFIVDPHEETRESLCTLFQDADLATHSFSTAEEFLGVVEPGVTGCLVTEEVLPGMSGSDLQEMIRDQKLDIPVVFLTAHGSVRNAVRCLKRGAADYVEKPHDPDDLLRVVQRAIEQDRARRAAVAGINRRLAQLTPRQRQVLDLVVDGTPNKAIGLKLGISRKTVEIHRAKMMEIMQARSVASLVKMMVASEDLWSSSQTGQGPDPSHSSE